MKKSETIKAEIERLETEYEARVKAEVFDSIGRQTPEDHDRLWGLFYEGYGRANRRRKEELEFELWKELNREIEVGDGVTECLYSDRHAYTVIARTRTTLTIQKDKATLDPDFKPEWVVGGFAGHCTNQEEQTWSYEHDPEGAIVKCRWSEKRGRWQTGSDGSIGIIRGRHEFHDYNF